MLERYLAILTLDTRFPRPLGDLGNLQSWPVQAKQMVVKGAFPDKLVASAASLRKEGMLRSFQTTVQSPLMRGAAAITTTCGFLVLLQADLQRVSRVPVVTSSLLMLPKLLQRCERVGVLTISASKLGQDHLRAAGVAREDLTRVVVQGVDPQSEFVCRILGNEPRMDFAQCEQDLRAAARALKIRAPDLTDIVLECTNMPPHRAAIEAETGCKTWTLLEDARLTAWARN